MNILSDSEFEKICGKMMPLRRDMSTFNGDNFQCACGREHTFYSGMISVVSEGFNGKFIVICPDNRQLASLIKTRMKFGIMYQGLQYLAGCEIDR